MTPGEKKKRDLILINRALETGDPAAYSELMRHYRDRLYFSIYEKVGDQEISKDLTIESLGKAFKKLHLYKPDFAFSTWLFTVAKNHSIDYLRKNKLPTFSICLLYTSPSPRDGLLSRMPSSA